VRITLVGLVAGLGILGGACVGVIDGGPNGSPPGDDESEADAGVDAAPADFTVRVTDSARGELGTVIRQTIDVSGSHVGGPVTLAAIGAPAGWSIAIEPATITQVAGEGAAPPATMTITIPTNADAAPTGVPITVSATGGPGTRTATTVVTVANVFTMKIGTPGAGGQHFESYANGQLRMKRGAMLRIVNTDAIAHRVHSDAGVDGFPHQASSMPTGAAYEVTLGESGSDLFYCHDHGQGTGEVRLTVE
jgi:hypothetical protein